MIIKCPNCNGALEFDVKSGLMYCKFCGSFFTAEEVAMPETDPADTEGVSPWSPSEISDEVGTFNSGIEVTQYTDARGYNSNPQNYVFDIPTDIREANRTRYYEEQARLSEEYRARPKPDYTKPFAGTSDPRANMTKEERDYNVQEYYAKQAQLSEEYHRNKPDIDYTKPFDGTTRENMTMDEIVEANRRDREAREKMQAELDRIEKRAVFGSSSYPGAFGAYATEVNRATQEYERNINQKIALAGKTTPVTSQAWQTAADVAKANAGSERKPKEYMYTPSGSRIIQNTGGVYLVTDAPPDYGAEMMDNKVYTCTTCGAELGLTGVETSSFCAYCGQPTIVFSRMEKCSKPDSIIPFHVTKEDALSLVRNRLNKGLLVPTEVKNFEVNKLCGIYIPYWLFDANYTDSMVIKSRVKQGKSSTIKHYRVNTQCNLFYFPVDASKNLNDYSSRKLDPYDYSGLRPFHPSYMSGFYSDRFDMSSDQMSMTAMYRAQSMMYDKAKTKVPGSPIGMEDSAPMFHIRKKYYTMLPAWFLSFRYEFNTYTIMVNGQTGKVVGAVPYDQKKFYAIFGAAFAAASAIAIPLSVALTKAVLFSTSSSSNSGKALALPFIVGGFFFMLGQANYKKYKRNMELAREEQMTNFVKERQEV